MLAEAIKVKILGVNERCKQGCMGSVYVQEYHSICLFEGSTRGALVEPQL